ncbi:MAG: hypothetical protein J6K72_07375 [Clostridia bacterium]|nr:hypothetical protein [Clostridia bacterium]
MTKKSLLLMLSLVLALTIGLGSTLAYLTDRDVETNVFTMGNVDIDLNEDFEQGSTLIPGQEIEKKPTITNTGDTDAWVWLTFSIPTALDNPVQGTEQGSNKNIIHWNPKGATTEGYVTDDRVNAALEAGFFDGYIPEGVELSAEYINENKMHWNVFNSIAEGENMYQEEINGVPYNTYVLVYNKALEPGETTLPNIEKVYMDAQIDIDPKGDLYRVVNGEVTPVDWNINEDGAPIIYAAAYAVQKEGFETPQAAYAAYNAQWGDKGNAIAPSTVKVTSLSEMKTALKEAEENNKPVLIDAQGNNLGDLDNVTFPDGTIVRNAIFTGDASHGSYGNGAKGTVTFIDCTFDSEYAYAAHFDHGDGELVFSKCKFSGWNSFGTAIQSLTFTDCEFTHNGYYGIVRAYQNASFKDCSFSSDMEGADISEKVPAGTVVSFENCDGLGVDKIYYNSNSKGETAQGKATFIVDGVDVSSQCKVW